MNFRLLTKEQFESLHQEFANFLAVQEIDKSIWDHYKRTAPEKVNQILEQFSDLVWTEVLNKTNYLEHYSKDSINLFCCENDKMVRIVVKIDKEGTNLLEKDDFNWFLDHSDDDSIHYFKGEKKYNVSRNEEIFKIIEEGGIISDGKLYNAISRLIHR